MFGSVEGQPLRGSEYVSPQSIALGHNGGPPLDVSWSAWNWRRAHAEAWKSPGRDIVLLRLRRAAGLGLGYRDYTSVILDRGARLSGLILMLRRPLLPFEDRIARKLESLRDCRVTVLGARISIEFATRVRAMGGRVMDFRTIPEREPRAQAVRRLAAEAGTPSATFMVGTTEDERQAAQHAGLGLFVAAPCYFDLRV